MVPIAGLLAVVGALGGIKACQIGSLMAMGKKAAADGPPPEAVGTAKTDARQWEETIPAVGSIASTQGVGLSNESPGVVTKIAFESGAMVEKGQLLVELDTRVERAQLAAAQARRELADSVAGRTRALVDKGAISKAELDSDDAALKASTNDVEGLRGQIARKSIRAPFAGRLGIRNVNLGQYLNPGTVVTMLEALDSVYVDFSLPQQRLAEVAVGMPVRMELSADEADGGGARESWTGAVAAVDPTVDAATRNIKIRATVPKTEAKLRPGMFVNVEVVLPKKVDRVVAPLTAIVHAPYGDSVFVVEDKKPDSGGMTVTPDGKTVKIARQQFVRVGEARGDFVALLDGVSAGQELIVAGAFKLRNGAPVIVDNTVKPEPHLDPRPENQ